MMSLPFKQLRESRSSRGLRYIPPNSILAYLGTKIKFVFYQLHHNLSILQVYLSVPVVTDIRCLNYATRLSEPPDSYRGGVWDFTPFCYPTHISHRFRECRTVFLCSSFRAVRFSMSGEFHFKVCLEQFYSSLLFFRNSKFRTLPY